MTDLSWIEMEELIQKSQLGDNSEFADTTSFSHQELSDRLRKTFYYSPHKTPAKDTLSFPITQATVDSFRKVAPTSFGKLGHRYASRVARDACISPCSMLIAMIYLERLSHRNPEYLKNIPSSDLFLVSMMVASKFVYDEGICEEVFNDEWAISGLSDTDHVNSLEADFLTAIDWRVLVRKAEFTRMLGLFEQRLAIDHGFNRGWYSYADVGVLVDNQKFLAQIYLSVNYCAKVLCTCFAIYSSVILTTVGAVLIAKSVGSNMKSSMPGAPLPIQQQSENNSMQIQMDMNSTNNGEPLTTVIEVKNIGDIKQVLENMDNPPVDVTQPTLKQTSPQTEIMANSVQVFALLETVFFISNLPKSTSSESNVFNGLCSKCQQHVSQQKKIEKQNIRKRTAQVENEKYTNFTMSGSSYMRATEFDIGLEMKCKPPSQLLEEVSMQHSLNNARHSTMSTLSPFITTY